MCTVYNSADGVLQWGGTKRQRKFKSWIDIISVYEPVDGSVETNAVSSKSIQVK